jgi:cytochrome c oxidase cbb3-type subunit III
VTLPSGAKPSGAPVYADAFTVTLRHQNGWTKSFPINAAKPEIHDPLMAHREFLATYTDKNSHDLFAWKL